jgi:hypothetical protein
MENQRATMFVRFLRVIVPLLVVAGTISCGGASSGHTSPPGGGGGGGGGTQGVRTVNDMLFAADFNRITANGPGWCPTDSAGNTAAITTLRIWDSGMKWADIETAPGVFDWSNMDLTVNTLATNPNCLMSVIYTFGNTPEWAGACAGQADPSPCLPGPTSSGFGGGVQCAPGDGSFDFSCVPPSDVNSDGSGTDSQYQTFINTLVTRYTGKIAYYEVWNEQDSPNFWCPDSTSTNPSPSTCTGSIPRAVRMGWDLWNIVHCVDPKAQVLSPSFHGFSAGAGGWMNLYSTTSISAPAGSIGNCSWNAATVTGKQTFDITNFHGRGSPTSDPTGFLKVYNEAAGEIQRDSLPQALFDDENGYIGTADAPNVDMQSAYVAISYILRASVTNPPILLSAWYSWDAPQGELQGTNAGLAYDVVAGWLSGSTLSGGCTAGATLIYSCSGTTAAGKAFIITWDSSPTSSSSCLSACTTTNQPLPANAAYTSYTDITGTQHSISGGATPVGYQPILIE